MDYQSAWKDLKRWLTEGVNYMKMQTEVYEEVENMDLSLICSAQGKGYKIALEKMLDLEKDIQ